MPSRIILANESDATSVPSGTYDVRVSGGALCFFDSSLNKSVAVMADSSGDVGGLGEVGAERFSQSIAINLGRYEAAAKTIDVSTTSVNLDLFTIDISATNASCIGHLELWGLRADNFNGQERWSCDFAAGEVAPTFSVGTLTTEYTGKGAFPADPVVAWSGSGYSRALQLQLDGSNHSYSIWYVSIRVIHRKASVTF